MRKPASHSDKKRRGSRAERLVDGLIALLLLGAIGMLGFTLARWMARW